MEKEHEQATPCARMYCAACKAFSAAKSGIQVGRGVDLAGHRPDVDLEALLHFLQHGCIFVAADEGDCETFRAEATGSADAVQVGIAIVWHVIVDYDVHALNVDAAAEEVRGDHNALLKLLELLVARDAVLLVEARVDGDGREVALHQQLVQGDGPLHRLHEDHDLVELQGVQEVVELAVLLLLCKLHVVLQKPVKRKLGLLVHPDLVRVLHELLAESPRLGAHCRTEHHHLLLFWRVNEDLLHVLAHVKLV
mmetsp:Transcript_10062/g.30766  ORF Transcript_10062/g.30766 Transcript_10062/m.30766 type:complete len:252 (+) Transcript_10062:39-794(+)